MTHKNVHSLSSAKKGFWDHIFAQNFQEEDLHRPLQSRDRRKTQNRQQRYRAWSRCCPHHVLTFSTGILPRRSCTDLQAAERRDKAHPVRVGHAVSHGAGLADVREELCNHTGVSHKNHRELCHLQASAQLLVELEKPESPETERRPQSGDHRSSMLT